MFRNACVLLVVGLSANAAEPKGGLARINPADCAGFTPADAAPFLGAKAAQVSRRVDKIGDNHFACSYAVGKAGPGVAFSLELAPSAKLAEQEMERYRADLETAAEVPPWKGRLPKGAYSDIMGPGMGDEAVWTDINGTLTVRKGNVKLQVTMPQAKLAQVKLAEAVVRKF